MERDLLFLFVCFVNVVLKTINKEPKVFTCKRNQGFQMSDLSDV